MKVFDSVDADGSREIDVDEFKMWAKRNWIQKDADGLALQLQVDSKEVKSRKEQGTSNANSDHAMHKLVTMMNQNLIQKVIHTKCFSYRFSSLVSQILHFLFIN